MGDEDVTDLKITCNRCHQELAHHCGGDVLEAVEHLLRWVPECGGEPAVVRAFKKSQYPPGPNDREMPFFGSQCWSYSILGKEDARTFHALIHNLVRALGIDPNEIENKLAQARADELEERKRREDRRRGFKPKRRPVCAACKDTHRMELEDRTVPCTKCPTPCDACRGKLSAYCATTPCTCDCHRRTKR